MPLAPTLMKPPVGNTGPASPPTGNPGLMADALTKVREAVRLLEMALPNFPVGSDPHKDTLKAIQSLSKSVPASAEVPGVQQTTLADLQQQAQKSAMFQQVQRSLAAQGGGAPAQPGAPPPQPAAA